MVLEEPGYEARVKFFVIFIQKILTGQKLWQGALWLQLPLMFTATPGQ